MNGQQKEYHSADRKTVLSSLAQLPKDQKSRAAQLMKYAPFGIRNAEVHVIDSRIEFSGSQNVEYVVSLAYAKNQENSKTRGLAYVNK
ncbi:hypothetical protein, partial [Natrialba sp. PRR66]|uniref:hypothetical protein n=1 Tax=Natrialba sp. PRR66 TaxID=3098146 RepID=UPI002B1E3C10